MPLLGIMTGVWRTLQIHQDASDNPQRRRWLISKNVNFMFHVPEQHAFCIHLNTDIKRKTPVVTYLRQQEVPVVYDLMVRWVHHSRRRLIRTVRDKAAARDYLFFNATTGLPLDTASKMSHWIGRLVTTAAVQLGLYPNRAAKIRGTPHTFR